MSAAGCSLKNQRMLLITDIRGTGRMAAIDVAPPRWPGARGEGGKCLFEAGLHSVFTEDAGFELPPLVSTRERTDEVLRNLA